MKADALRLMSGRKVSGWLIITIEPDNEADVGWL